MTLTPAQLDRAVGVLLGTAAGDALGAAYEFGPPRGPELEVAMVGGGSFGWEPGEWTDDTSMAIAIAEVAATGADLREEEALDALVRRWHEWSQDAKDVGIQTSPSSARAGWLGSRAQTAREASAALHERTGRTAGNGSLMRTAPLALAYLDDEAALVEAARAVSELTHYDPEAGDACVLWCLAIRHAVLTGELDVRIGLQHIDADRRETVGIAARRRRNVTAFGLHEQRVGGRGAAGCVVGDHDHARPAGRSGQRCLPRRSPAPGARRRGARRRGHRHRRGHRGRTARRCLRGVSGPRGVASRAARLAGSAHPRPRRARVRDHPQGRARRVRLQLQRVRIGRCRKASL